MEAQILHNSGMPFKRRFVVSALIIPETDGSVFTGSRRHLVNGVELNLGYAGTVTLQGVLLRKTGQTIIRASRPTSTSNISPFIGNEASILFDVLELGFVVHNLLLKFDDRCPFFF